MQENFNAQLIENQKCINNLQDKIKSLIEENDRLNNSLVNKKEDFDNLEKLYNEIKFKYQLQTNEKSKETKKSNI
jgi:hypothetical protein